MYPLGGELGGFFAGESMFSGEKNASKVALISMEQKLRAGGFILFDVQFLTPHLESMGAVEIPRVDYLRRLRDAVAQKATFMAACACATVAFGLRRPIRNPHVFPRFST